MATKVLKDVELTEDNVRSLLRQRCKEAGGVKHFAWANSMSRQYLYLVIEGHKPVPKSVSEALGLDYIGKRWVVK